MVKSQFELNKEVAVTTKDGVDPIKGVLKGINEGYDGKVLATVEYMTPTRQTFELEKVTV